MHVIFSRKGFDSQYGGVPSPILPDGTMLSLPIPLSVESQCLGALRFDGLDVGQLAADLTDNRIVAGTTVHVDPDLHGPTLERLSGWRPAFGQIAAAQSHLKKRGVGVGDVFLFFGWFRRVESINGHWRYVPSCGGMHVLFGWLQIGDVLPVSGRVQEVVSRYPWLSRHPHVSVADRFKSTNNTIYVASDFLRIDDIATGRSGGGVFERFSPNLVLTAPGQTRSRWLLPAWFVPAEGRPSLSYHGNQARWTLREDSVLLQTVAKGQEFVLDCDHYPEAANWLTNLFAQHHVPVVGPL